MQQQPVKHDTDLGAGGVDIDDAGIDPSEMVEVPEEQVIESTDE